MKFKILFLTILTSVVLLATSAYSADELKLNVMGVDITSIAQPQLIDGRTMVPVRAIYEAVGAEVEWDSATKTITGTRKQTTVVMQIGSNDITINGISTEMEAQPLIIDGRTLAPARYVAESFGYEVQWDSDTKTVSIISDEIADETTEVTTEETTSIDETEEISEEASVNDEAEEDSETTTEEIIYISSLSQNMTKQIKSDIKAAIGSHRLGNYSELARFTESYRTNLFKTWAGLAQTESDEQYVAASKNFYLKINAFFYTLDLHYNSYKSNQTWSDELKNQCEYYIDKLDKLYLAYANAETLTEVNSVAEDLSDNSKEFSTYISTRTKNY